MKSETPFVPGDWLRSFSGAPLAEPAPGAEELDPADVERALGRDADARAVAVRRALDDAVAHEDAARAARIAAKKSPLTPTIVAVDERRFCIAVTRSRPWIASFESTGRSA